MTAFIAIIQGNNELNFAKIQTEERKK